MLKKKLLFTKTNKEKKNHDLHSFLWFPIKINIKFKRKKIFQYFRLKNGVFYIYQLFCFF